MSDQPSNIVLFPTAAQTGRIRDVADRYREKSPKQAGAYWFVQTEEMARNLHCIGLSDREIERELIVFRDAVRDEISGHGRAPVGGDAA